MAWIVNAIRAMFRIASMQKRVYENLPNW